MSRLSPSSLSVLALLLVLVIHVHLTTGQPNCNSISCAPDHSASCVSCNSSATHCDKAWYNYPGVSCGTAVSKSSTGRVIYNAQCCPERYSGSAYHCQSMSYSATSAGVTYDVEGFSCVKEQDGLGAAAVVGIVTCGLVTCVALLLIGYYFYRRRLAALTADLLSPSDDAEASGSYTAPLMQSQPPQPFSTQPYNLDMQQPYAAPSYTIREEPGQPQSSSNRQPYNRQ